MEESGNGKRSKTSNGKEDQVLKKIKLESDNKSDYECSERNKIENQKDAETAKGNEKEPIMGRMKFEQEDKQGNEPGESKKKIPQEKDEKIRKDEEYHILRLFTHVLNTVLDEKEVKDADVAKSIIQIRDSHKHDEKTGYPTFHKIDFTKWENICGYLYRYTSHGAGFTRFQTLHAIRNCKFVEKVLKKPNLKIICLGSGPGNDLVGVCSALAELQYPGSLSVTLVDKFKQWRFCMKLAKTFIEEGNYGKVSELFQNTKVELEFSQTDLPGDLKLNQKYFKRLAEADVIVMTKLVTILDRSNYGESERTITESLCRYTKKGAFILLNDIYIEERWAGFYRLYNWERDENNKYQSTALAEDRFEYRDDASSKLSLHVLVKERDRDYCEKINSA